MDETFQTSGIVLKREASGERNSLVFLYTHEHGKLTLMARGTRTLSSKLAAHLEPLSLTEVMVVRGRGVDYVGSAVCQMTFHNIHANYYQRVTAGEITRIADTLIGEREPDSRIFELLHTALSVLNDHELSSEQQKFLRDATTLKLLALLGYQPELYHCMRCHQALTPGGNSFSAAAGGVICSKCRTPNEVVVSDEVIKVLRLFMEKPLRDVVRIEMRDNQKDEISQVIQGFLQYYLT